jgi:dUTPase
MLLNNQDIEGRKLIRGAVPANYQPGGYDVSIAEIVDADGRMVAGQTHKLPPQGIAWAVSAETVTLPDDVLGYATIRTSLCNEGVLALNIGIVDPGWSGPISTAFINFGKDDFILEKGEKFLRLTFHSAGATPSKRGATADFRDQAARDPNKAAEFREKYIKKVRHRARHHFGDTFLNLGSRLAREQRRAAIKNLPIYGFAAALFSIALTVRLAFHISRRGEPQTIFAKHLRVAMLSRLTFSKQEMRAYLSWRPL